MFWKNCNVMSFYLSLFETCGKHVFLPMGLCILFSVAVWTSFQIHTFTIQTHTFKATLSLIQITYVSQMWTVILVCFNTCVCVCCCMVAKASLSQHMWSLGEDIDCQRPWLPSTCVWNTVLMWFISSMLSSRLSPAEQSISTNYCWKYSVSKPLCSSLAIEMKSDC